MKLTPLASAEGEPQLEPSGNAIQAENLTKVYGTRRVVDHVSFQVAHGEVLGFLGPNGAGKTTTMRILAGYTPPTSGRAFIGGHDVASDGFRARARIGYLPENAPLYLQMTVRDYLRFMAEIKGCRRVALHKTLDAAVEECGLGEAAGRVIGNLSRGFRQRVGLAQAILGDPEVLILDEPTVGLDPRQIAEIRRMIKGMAGRRTVLLSTHILPEVGMLCRKVIVIDRGKIVASGTPEKLVSSLKTEEPIAVTIEGDGAKARELIERVGGILRVELREDTDAGRPSFRIYPSALSDPRAEIAKMLVQGGIGVVEIGALGASLEDVFLRVISSAEGN